jgi:hypothetical protein
MVRRTNGGNQDFCFEKSHAKTQKSHAEHRLGELIRSAAARQEPRPTSPASPYQVCGRAPRFLGSFLLLGQSLNCFGQKRIEAIGIDFVDPERVGRAPRLPMPIDHGFAEGKLTSSLNRNINVSTGE